MPATNLITITRTSNVSMKSQPVPYLHAMQYAYYAIPNYMAGRETELKINAYKNFSSKSENFKL